MTEIRFIMTITYMSLKIFMLVTRMTLNICTISETPWTSPSQTRRCTFCYTLTSNFVAKIKSKCQFYPPVTVKGGDAVKTKWPFHPSSTSLVTTCFCDSLRTLAHRMQFRVQVWVVHSWSVMYIIWFLYAGFMYFLIFFVWLTHTFYSLKGNTFTRLLFTIIYHIEVGFINFNTRFILQRYDAKRGYSRLHKI